MIVLKSEREIELMAKSGKILSNILKNIQTVIKSGISTYEVDKWVEREILALGAIPAFKNYNGYKYSICLSLNDVIIHGVPSKNIILKEGDIISCDCGVIYEGYYSDACRTYPIGNINKEAKDLIEVTEECFFEGVKHCTIGNHISDISTAIQNYAESRGYGVVRDYIGHGIGTSLHEEPEIPNYSTGKKGPRIEKGMVLAIEPMITVGDYNTIVLKDGWSAATVDGSLAAHYENTVAITDEGAIILTE